jgi:hypothetical protein
LFVSLRSAAAYQPDVSTNSAISGSRRPTGEAPGRGYRIPVLGALAEYLARHVDDQVTERMNETLRDLGIEEDAFVSAASRRILAQVEW